MTQFSVNPENRLSRILQSKLEPGDGIFFIATAQAEVDENQNYEKAAALLRRAHQTMAKSEMSKERDQLLEIVLQKIRWIELYLEADRCVHSDSIRMQLI
jgi:hypothetical protein